MSSGPTVMVVEDEADLRDLFVTYLTDEYHVVTAADAEEALETIGPHVDVVLLDRLLPGTRDEEILPAIGERSECMVAMVTAIEPDFEIIDMGIDTYLTKPVSRDELLDTVDKLLQYRSYDDKLGELLELAQKQAALTEEKTEEELAESPEYHRLVDRLETLRHDLDDMQYRYSLGETERLFQELF